MTDVVLSLDWETRSECDIKKAGAFAYAAHPTTDILCAAYAFGDEEPELWLPGQPCPPRIAAHVEAGGRINAWNVSFEENVWEHIARPRYGWPRPRPETLFCTAAAAANLGLPRDLASAAAAIGGGAAQKDVIGKRVMMQLSRPRVGGGFWTVEDAPEKHAALWAYCKDDARAERGIAQRLYDLSPSERATFLLDRTINRRGIQIDRPLIEAAQEVVAAEMKRLDADMRGATGGAVTSCTQASRLCKWLGVESVAGHEIDALLERVLPDDHRAALLLRQEAAKSSTAKLTAMLAAAGAGDRVRGTTLYYGASGSGRFSGRLIQVQNFPRGNLAEEDVALAINLIQARDIEGLRLLFPSALEAVSSCLRGCLVAAPGKKLIACDYSNIEGRFAAWVAGEAWKVQAFRDFDAGTGPDLYKVAYGRAYGIDPKAVTKPGRQIGKVMELSCQYQGFVGAFQKMAANYGTAFTDEEAKANASAWREANPAIRDYWYKLNSAAIRAVASPGTKQPVGALTYLCANGWLWAKLPSGRVLAYARPSLKKNDRGEDAVHFYSVDQFTRKWSESSLYGGMLFNGCVQGSCRDLLVEAMHRLEGRGYTIIASIHDELIVEVPENFGSVEEMAGIMSELPAWAAGLPVVAEGYQGRRFKK